MGKPRSPKGRARLVHERLKLEYDAVCELNHDSPFELLVATILSAQCTDVRVNKTTPALFDRYPGPFELAAAEQKELEDLVHPTGFYKSKAKNLLKMSNQLLDDHGGEVPTELKDLVKLGGVGRKTANVIRSVAFGLPGLPVDTHVGRLARRLGLTEEEDPVKVEMDLNPMLPQYERGEFSLRVILHGRQVCFARNPRCEDCALNDFCPVAFDF
ncbi:MAG: endonuclease III [Actinomycetota bacterium]|nr:endonuclease III [Acidimicrobiaceae bacterium]MEC7915655.1 endonuclease III [Actinomycetota bacterium]MED5362241.1 endonuclease III [Actinomycetota bacterium]|tara:strand:- start:298 stop:939 length:642 start_codon:yes stop_codon:yes gene_type:complete